MWLLCSHSVFNCSYSKANDIFDMPRIHSNWIGAGMFKSDLLMKHLEPAQTTQLIGKTIIRLNSCPIIFILGVSAQCQHRASMCALTNTCLSTSVTLGEKCTAVSTTLYTSPKGTRVAISIMDAVTQQDHSGTSCTMNWKTQTTSATANPILWSVYLKAWHRLLLCFE